MNNHSIRSRGCARSSDARSRQYVWRILEAARRLTHPTIGRILSPGGIFMLHPRSAAFAAALASGWWIPAFGQSVISTHSGVVYFFEGSVFLGDQPLQQKFGKFPDIGEGGQLRTEHGRAEVLLTPGVMLRVAENSSIRMISTSLSDTRVELIGGSAIIESNEPQSGNSVTLIHKNWSARIPHEGVFRVDSDPPLVTVYKGEVNVSAGDDAGVAVRRSRQITPPRREFWTTQRSPGTQIFPPTQVPRSAADSAISRLPSFQA